MNGNTLQESRSPLSLIDTSFDRYVKMRQASAQEHMDGGVPDYSFALDEQMRKRVLQIPGFYSIGKKLLATRTAREMHMINQDGIAVGPNQFGDIYQMGVECAQKLGIGVPNIYVINRTDMNAYTIAADDMSPIIVLHSGIVERMTPGELKCVIAHECGHIHNNHAIPKCIVNILLSLGTAIPGAALLVSAANIALMNFWTRAGEITADRAAVICADNLQDALNVDYKLMYGAVLNNAEEMSIEALREQLKQIMDSPTRIMEVGQLYTNEKGQIVFAGKDHPGSIRRIFAAMEFAESDLYYKWRPEMKKPGAVMRSKQEVDDRCQKLINILNND